MTFGSHLVVGNTLDGIKMAQEVIQLTAVKWESYRVLRAEWGSFGGEGKKSFLISGKSPWKSLEAATV